MPTLEVHTRKPNIQAYLYVIYKGPIHVSIKEYNIECMVTYMYTTLVTKRYDLYMQCDTLNTLVRIL